MTNVETSYFRPLGLWNEIKHSKKCHIDSIFWIISVTHVSAQIMDTFISNYSFSHSTEKLSVSLTVAEGSAKILYYKIFCSESLNILVSVFDRNLLESVKHNKNQSYNIISQSARDVNVSVRGFVIMIYSTVLVWNLLPLLKCVFYHNCADLHIMPTWYPWDTTKFPINALMYCFEFFIMVYCSTSLYLVNCLFFALALLLSAQFHVLQENLSNLEKNSRRYAIVHSKTIETAMNDLLRECIKDHQHLLRLANLMEDVYNPMFLMQMLTSTVTICLVLLQLNMHDQEEMSFVLMFKFIMYLIFGLMELFLYSWGSQMVYEQSGAVHRGLYESGWELHFDKTFRKAILLAMLRSSKSQTLSAGKFYIVGLASFTQIIKASYSYFTFLHGSQPK